LDQDFLKNSLLPSGSKKIKVDTSMVLFKSPERQKREDEAWLAARGGKWPRPYGVYLGICTYACTYILIRTFLGLPKSIAPVFESPIVQIPLKVLVITSTLVFTVCVAHYMLSGFTLRSPYWVARWGKDRSTRVSAPVAGFLSLIVIEAFFGIFYLLELLIAKIT